MYILGVVIGLVLLIIVVGALYLLTRPRKRTSFYTYGVYYSIKENRLFYIPSHYTNGSNDLTLLKTNLKRGERILRQFVQSGNITCGEIIDSKRHKGKWYFSILCPPEKVPETITKLNHFTMWEFIGEV